MKHIVPNVPFISQLIKYPTGCESVSAVMAMQYLGYTGTVDDFIDNHLPLGKVPEKGEDGKYYGDDPWKCFPGTPYSKEFGWGCFAPVLEEAIAGIPGFTTETFYGLTLDELKSYLDQDIPLVFWGTIGFAAPYQSITWTTPENREIIWTCPMHCTLLIGYDDEGFYFNDPTSGEGAYFPRDRVEAAYLSQGSQVMRIKRCE
ncbi:MAG: C39 family peptidase [Lachnospiraceae bacterium]|nr:C39 family peptidase [Lachnospiraceae bacterium]